MAACELGTLSEAIRTFRKLRRRIVAELGLHPLDPAVDRELIERFDYLPLRVQRALLREACRRRLRRLMVQL